jgi:hypothetical protein
MFYNIDTSSAMVSLQGLMSVTSFLPIKFLPFLIISSNSGFFWSFRLAISSIWSQGHKTVFSRR